MPSDFGLSGFVILAGLAAVSTLAFMLFRGRGAAPVARASDAAVAPELSAFLFSGERLVDASAPARRLLEGGPRGLADWPRLMSRLAPRFPGLDEALARLGAQESLMLDDCDQRERLVLQRRNDLLRLVLEPLLRSADHGAAASFGPAPTPLAPAETLLSAEPAPPATDHSSSIAAASRAQAAELEMLRQFADAAPVLAWQEGADGRVIWANGSYLDSIASTLPEGDVLTWPLPRLFEESARAGQGRRALKLADGTHRWFDISAAPSPEAGLCFALPADDTVRAETALARFTQTLSRTFADLPTGVAIFDQARQLVLFNPALIDICLLDPAFLSARPRLHAVLDALRDRQMIPEPRDYKAWRSEIGALERAAEAGAYRELWPLIDGRTLRVTGRPHGDGALAFLIEDVTAEMAFSRRARGDIDLGQATLDSFDEAVAVFAVDGARILANRAYARLWPQSAAIMPEEDGIEAAQALWSRRCMPGPALDALLHESMVGEAASRAIGPLTLQDGRQMLVRLAGLAGGARLVGFTPEPDNPALAGARGNSRLGAGRSGADARKLAASRKRAAAGGTARAHR